MNLIQNIIEPERLLLVWQRPLQDGVRRDRHVVAEIIREESDSAVFRYLHETPDYQAAVAEGFKGYYPSFPLIPREEHCGDVLHTFTARLLSRKRGDFGDYLASHYLPSDFKGSDFSLLAHTGARLPSDGFEIVADLASLRKPFDLIIEVAGTRHQKELHFEALKVGDPVTFTIEKDNPVDKKAVLVSHREGGSLGYIPKHHSALLHAQFADGRVNASIAKLNDSSERRLIYLLARFSPQLIIEGLK